MGSENAGHVTKIKYKEWSNLLSLTNSSPTIIWFRQDLRLADNPAFSEACKNGQVIPVYILDEQAAGSWALGGAGQASSALLALDNKLEQHLNIFKGDPLEILMSLVEEYEAKAVY